MKRYLKISILLFIFIAIFSIKNNALANLEGSYDENGFLIMIDKEAKKAYLADYIGNSDYVVINNSYNGYPVVGVINHVGYGPFENAPSVKTVVIMPGVEEFEFGVFSNSSIDTIILQDGFTKVPNNLAYDCTTLKTVQLPSSVKEIGQSAFSGCTSLENFEFSSTLNKIGNTAFYKTGLKTLTIPSNITEIGKYAFGACSNLSKVTLPETELTINGGAFYNCSKLTSIEIPKDTKFVTRELISDSTYATAGIFEESGLTSVTLKTGRTSLGELLVFKNCNNLKEIKFPETMEEIDQYTFSNCKGLENVTIPNNVKIRHGAFEYCTNLKTVTISSDYEDGIFTINTKCFNGCTALKTLKLPENTELYSDYSNLFDNMNPDFTLYVVEGSSAETWAKKQNAKYATYTLSEVKNISKCNIADIGNRTYTGSAIRPSIVIKDGTKTLVKDTDYTVSYSNNAKVGTATVTITGKGNYIGTVTKTFNIINKTTTTKQISQLTISDIGNRTYTGSAIRPSIVIKDGTKTLVKDTDYTVSYSNNTKVGTATVTITGKGNYTGTVTKTFNIINKTTTKQISQLTISDIGNRTYTGTAIRPSVVITDGTKTLVKGTDYTVTFSDNVNIGTGKVTITGKGNYAGTVTKTFNIIAKSVSKVTVESIGNRTYTGLAIKPSLVVKDGSKTLVKGTDYKTTYSDNIKVGTAKIVITGIGTYSGTKEITFQIRPKPTSISMLKVGSRKITTVWKKQATETSGYQIQYATKVNFEDGKAFRVAGNSAVSKDITGLTSGKKYYVRVRTYKVVDNVYYYSAWSGAKSVIVK